MTYRVHVDGSIETTTIEEAFAVAVKWRTEAWEVPPSVPSGARDCDRCGDRFTPPFGSPGSTLCGSCRADQRRPRSTPIAIAEAEIRIGELIEINLGTGRARPCQTDPLNDPRPVAPPHIQAHAENAIRNAELTPENRPDLYECAECREKPGSPALCDRCLDARSKAGAAWRGTPLPHLDADYSKPVGSPEWWAAFYKEHGRDPSPAELTAASEKIRTNGVPGFGATYGMDLDQRVETKRASMRAVGSEMRPLCSLHAVGIAFAKIVEPDICSICNRQSPEGLRTTET